MFDLNKNQPKTSGETTAPAINKPAEKPVSNGPAPTAPKQPSVSKMGGPKIKENKTAPSNDNKVLKHMGLNESDIKANDKIEPKHNPWDDEEPQNPTSPVKDDNIMAEDSFENTPATPDYVGELKNVGFRTLKKNGSATVMYNPKTDEQVYYDPDTGTISDGEGKLFKDWEYLRKLGR